MLLKEKEWPAILRRAADRVDHGSCQHRMGVLRDGKPYGGTDPKVLLDDARDVCASGKICAEYGE